MDTGAQTPQRPTFLYKGMRSMFKPRLRIVKRTQDRSEDIPGFRLQQQLRKYTTGLTEASSQTSKQSGLHSLSPTSFPWIRSAKRMFSASSSTRQRSVQGSPCKAGDKPYSRVEYSPDFFKTGGLVTGSSNVFRARHIGRNRDPQVIHSYEATNPPRVKWADRAKHERLRDERQAVEALSNWKPIENIEEFPVCYIGDMQGII